MAVAVAATDSRRFDTQGTSFSNATYNHPGGTQSALLVAINARGEATGETYSFTVMWDGAAVTQIIGVVGVTITSNEQAHWVGILRGATTGARTLSIQVSGGDVLGCHVRLVSLTGVKQTGNPWGSGANSPAQIREIGTLASITDDLTTTAADSMVVVLAGFCRGSDVPTFSAWNAGWTVLGAAQYGTFTALSAASALGASAYRSVAASGTTVTATGTITTTCVRRTMTLVEILAEVGGGGGSGLDKGVLGVGPINGQDAGQHFLIRRDAVGDSGGATNTYAIRANFSDGAYRIEGPSAIADTGDDVIIAIRRTAGQSPILFINGAEVTPSFESATVPVGALSVPVGPLYIGAGSKDSATGGWTGLIDEFRWKPSLVPIRHLVAESLMWRDARRVYGLGDRNAFGETKSPVAIPLFFDAEGNTSTVIDIVAAIVNSSSASVTLDSVTNPSAGTVSVQDNKAVITPPVGFTGQIEFTYQISIP